MKYKLVEKTPVPAPPKKQGWWTEPQLVKNILILNVFKDGKLYASHAINTETKEYATLKEKTWRMTQITDALGLDNYWYGSEDRKRLRLSAEGREIVLNALGITSRNENIMENIRYLEREYASELYTTREKRRMARVDALMDTVPEIPEDLTEFVDQKLAGGKNWCLKRRKDTWYCTNCGKEIKKKKLSSIKPDLKEKEEITCPNCGAKIEYRARKKTVDISTYVVLVQPIDEEKAVVRHIKCGAFADGKKKIWMDENIRIMICKKELLRNAYCDIYYNQGYNNRFDRHNPANKRTGTGYLYDGGIEEAFAGTRYESMTRLFVQLAAAGQKADYNNLMIIAGNKKDRTLFEMLYKNRFYRLFEQQSENISHWSWEYFGLLKTGGNTIEEVFDISDRQMINRIRERDGDSTEIEWLRWSLRHKAKVSDKVLNWAKGSHMLPNKMSWMLVRMSPEQAVNYIERQRRESYKGSSPNKVVEQYEDYMNMCKKLKKDTNDPMIYKARELKRRHDECVIEIERQEADIKATEYSEKYPEAEEVLKEIKEKFTYTGEEYFIRVPEKIIDIVLEGRFLHHCAGATDRYFDRIKDHETYICFLRKTAEPDTPFYTIEVEPGGTIRQHRGMYDEEPDIEKIKPFLREWQKEIRKRMKEEDHERAKRSEELRELNIRELREKNNTRVLKGLEEDFMAAVG